MGGLDYYLDVDRKLVLTSVSAVVDVVVDIVVVVGGVCVGRDEGFTVVWCRIL